MRNLIILAFILAFAVGISTSYSAEQFQANALGDFLNRLWQGGNSIAEQEEELRQETVEPELKGQDIAPAPLDLTAFTYEEAVTKAVERAEPSVVSVIVSKDLPIIEQCAYDPFSDIPPEFRQFFGDDFGFTQPCERGTELREIGGGSGFIISSDGMIVTNRHVIADDKASYTVLTNDGKKHEATVLARDPFRDFAVIKINAVNLPVLRLGNSDVVKLGQPVIAIGNALGEFRNTVSAGVISGLARDIVASGGGVTERIEGVFQTDAAVNEGNSGGPLLNLKGEVIGVNVATVMGAQSIGFSIPINQLKSAIDSVIRTGKISIPFLGVRYRVITQEFAQREGLSVDYGVLLRGSQEGPAVMPDTPAARAGLQAEDVILEFNGTKLDEQSSLASLIRKARVGDTVTLTILRNGQRLTLRATLEERSF